MTQVAYRRCRFVVGGTVLLCVAAAFGLPRLGISSDMLGYFGEKTVHRVDSRFIDEHLGGSLMINLMVEAPNVLEPEVLRGFEQMEAYLSEQPEVRFVNSPSSTVKLLHERYFGDPQRYRIPDTLAAVTQLVEQISGTALFKSHVNPSATVGHLTARFDGRRLENVIENNPRLESRLAAAFAGTAQGYVTGYGKLVIRMHHYIPTSQVRSFFIAFVVIGLMITVLFRSLRIGIWAIFPNVVPIVVMLGGMGFTGFDLDVATVMIASILLGLIVDDTVHFLARFRIEEQRALAQGSSDAMREALYQTGTGTGRALLTTTVILSCAFWTLILANFVPIRHFGLVSGVGAAIALLCDLVLLPATMRWFPLRKLARRMVVESRAHSLVESERKWNWSQVSTDTAANSDHSGASRP